MPARIAADGSFWPSPSAAILAGMHDLAQAERLSGVGIEARGSVVLDEEFESRTTPTFEEVTGKSEEQVLAESRRDRSERNRAIREQRLVRTRRRPSVTGLAHNLPRTRSRQSRGTTTRTRGSRRTSSSSSSRAGPSDDPGEPEPGPRSGQLYLAHPRFGKVSRALAHHLRRLGL